MHYFFSCGGNLCQFSETSNVQLENCDREHEPQNIVDLLTKLNIISDFSDNSIFTEANSISDLDNQSKQFCNINTIPLTFNLIVLQHL